MATPDPTRRPRAVPRGTAPAVTDDALDALAAITPEDLERAQLAWRRDARGTGLENLLDAEPVDDGDAG